MLKNSHEGGRVKTIIRTCKLLDRMGKGNLEVPPSHGIYYRILAEYYTRILKAEEEGSFIAAHTVWFPAEILYALKIIPLHIEITSWMTALFSGNYADLLSVSAAVGIAPETCSPYRVLIGAFSTHAIPRPTVVISSNLICDNNAKIGELIRHLVDRPGFFLDCPFQRSNSENRYLKMELEEMIHFLEEKSARKMDWDRLRESIARLNKHIELLRQIDALRRNIPSPFIPNDFLKLFTVDCLYPGEPEAIEYLEAVHKELIDQVSGRGLKESYPQEDAGIAEALPFPFLALVGQEEIDKWEERFSSFFLLHNKRELYREAVSRGIMLYTVNTAEDILNDPQLKSRGFWKHVEHPEFGVPLVYPGVPLKSTEVTFDIKCRAPQIGEHNKDIYCGELGLLEEQLLALKQSNII